MLYIRHGCVSRDGTLPNKASAVFAFMLAFVQLLKREKKNETGTWCGINNIYAAKFIQLTAKLPAVCKAIQNQQFVVSSSCD